MLDLIINRLTPTQLSEPGPSSAQLGQALLAAQAAPDHGRLAPWRFIVIEGAARGKFGKALARALKERDPAASPELLDKEAQKPLRAPLTVVVAAVAQPHPKVPEIEQVMAVSAATQNLILALHAQGFAAQWKTGPAAFDGRVKAELGLHPADTIVGFIYIGTAADAGKPRPPVDGRVVVWK